MPETESPTVLVVVQPFHGYQRGEEIADQEKVREILESEWSEHVVKRAG